MSLEDEQGSARSRIPGNVGGGFGTGHSVMSLVESPVGSCSWLGAENVQRWVTRLERSRRVVQIMSDLISPGLCPKDTGGSGTILSREATAWSLCIGRPSGAGWRRSLGCRDQEGLDAGGRWSGALGLFLLEYPNKTLLHTSLQKKGNSFFHGFKQDLACRLFEFGWKSNCDFYSFSSCA